MNTLRLKIITPKKIVLEEEVLSVTAPAETGEITILPKHIRLFTLLVEGIIKIKKPNEEDYLAIGGGYLQTDGQELNILVSRAYGQKEIDEKLTEKAIEEAKKIISLTKDRQQRVEAAALLRRSIVDLKLLKKRKRPV
jgi:F-type H+-transporting ATPase subunit epsilon